MTARQTILTTAAATVLLASGAAAQEVYKGLAEDNPDLTGNPSLAPSQEAKKGTQSKADVYKGLAEDNADIVDPMEAEKGPTSKNPDIYEELEPSSDLTY